MDDTRMTDTCRSDGGVTPLPASPVPVMAYILFQQWGETYTAERALESGTLFPELNKPFLGKRGVPDE